MNGSIPEARKSLFAKQGSFGGLTAAGTGEGEGGLSETRNGNGRGEQERVQGRGEQENIGEGGELFTEGIFTLSCRGEVEKVR